MTQIVLASHSNLARGMYDTLKFFTQDVGHVTPICAYGEHEAFEPQFLQFLEEHRGEEVLVFTDLVGGSVNQVACRLLPHYPMKVVAGMNLVAVLEAVMSAGELNDDFLARLVEDARKQLVFMNPIIEAGPRDDGDGLD